MKTFDELWDEKVKEGPVSLELRPIVKRWFIAGQMEANKDHYHGQVEDLMSDNEQLAIALEKMRNDLTSVCPENWTEDPDWERLVRAHGLKTPNAEVWGLSAAGREGPTRPTCSAAESNEGTK